MADVFIGSLMLVPYNFEPYGFAFCDGRLLSIPQNSALFSLIGNYFGGDGKNNFALPDLRGRVPIGAGQGPGLSNYQFAQASGVETVTLQATQMPAHNHPMVASTGSANQSTAANNALANPGKNIYNNQSLPADAAMDATAVSGVGGGAAHDNMMPFQAMNWIIALQGIYPTRS